MNEKSKISEAEYFLSLMLAEESNREHFRYNLSAFLSAARSVLQYAREEAKTESGGQRWYDERVSKSETLKVFRVERDVNIHEMPVEPQLEVGVNIQEGMCISSSFSAIVRDAKTGEIKRRVESRPAPPRPKPPKPKSTTSISRRYKFINWTRDEDVPTLSRKYLDEVKLLVDDGIKESFLSGQVGAASKRGGQL